MHDVLFLSQLLAITMDRANSRSSHCSCITWDTNKFHPVYNKDRRTRNCIPFLGQTRAKLYSLFGIERSKTIPCPTAHPRIGHIREYPPPPLRDRFWC